MNQQFPGPTEAAYPEPTFLKVLPKWNSLHELLHGRLADPIPGRRQGQQALENLFGTESRPGVEGEIEKAISKSRISYFWDSLSKVH